MLAAALTHTKSSNVSLRTTVSSVVSAHPDRGAVAHLVEASHRLALAYLIQKSRSGRLRASMFGLELDDLALDAIADLFQRDEKGRFVVLQTYFERYDEFQSENDAATSLRRLVFSKVNESLFRRYHEFDGNLSRIVRNLKDAAKALPRIVVFVQHRQPWLMVLEKGSARRMSHAKRAEDPRLQKPLAPAELVEGFFTSRLTRTDQVRDLVFHYIEFVDLNPEYSCGYPLVALAEIMRSAFATAGTVGETGTETSSEIFTTSEIEAAIEEVAGEVEREKKPGYVGKGKVDEKTYLAYFRTISEALAGQYLHDVESESYYAILSRHLASVTEEEYMRDHRNILEYLAKVVRGRLLDLLRAHAA